MTVVQPEVQLALINILSPADGQGVSAAASQPLDPRADSSSYILEEDIR